MKMDFESKYVAIITSEDERYNNGKEDSKGLDFFTDNPWEGIFECILVGDDAEELMDADSEGLFYQLYETKNGKRIGYGMLEYDSLKDEIEEHERKKGSNMNGYKYLVCGLSEEKPNKAKYNFCETLHDAFKICVDNVIEHFGFYRNMEDDILSKGKLNFLKLTNDGMNFSYTEGKETYYNSILELDPTPTKKTHLLVWYHCYRGVNFDIHIEGSKVTCRDKMYKEAKRSYEEYEGTDWNESETQISFHDSHEWRCWDIVEIP